MTITVTINAEQYHFKTKLSITELLVELKVDPTKIAIDKNYETIIPHSAFDQTFIEDNDDFEIVHFVGGG